MPEDLAELKANVMVYEKEIQTVFERAKNLPAAAPDEMTQAVIWGALLEMLGRRIDLMEKYEAALRDYVKGLENRNKALEKEIQKYQPRSER